MSSEENKPFVQSFLGKKKITSSEFIAIFQRYDQDGNGSIDCAEVDHFLKDLAKESGNEFKDDAEFREFKAKIIGMYDVDSDGKISMSELSKILPAEDNFLVRFREEVKLSSVDFIKIWYHYDTDRNGFLDTAELDGFLRDLFSACDKKKAVTPQRIFDYRTTIMELFDSNKDGKIELNEMSKILPVEENFFSQFEGKRDLSKEDFDAIFQHYDKDKNGLIEDSELIAFLRDVLQRDGGTPTTTELENYRTTILKVCDKNKDGKLNADELRFLLASK
ncbi:calbindin-32-like [Rhopilema esculentum]|uniref:calbindin-32-like n=1 Tax=Rhopilema esculentum TaxID=499914 RepID=UPI0031D471E8|eukprot:gene1754-16238_t